MSKLSFKNLYNKTEKKFTKNFIALKINITVYCMNKFK
jgi:hypothetical protein